MVNLSDILRRFEEYGMKLMPKKCQLLQDSVVIFGRLVSREGVQVPPGGITRIGNWGVPLCKREVQSFIGVLNFHRDHIPKFALVATSLYDIMGLSATFSWGTEQENAFDALRQKQSLLIQIQKIYLSCIQMPRIMLLELNCYWFRMEWNG